MGEQYKGSGGLMSLFKTRVPELLGMAYPVIAGAMGYITVSESQRWLLTPYALDSCLLPVMLLQRRR